MPGGVRPDVEGVPGARRLRRHSQGPVALGDEPELTRPGVLARYRPDQDITRGCVCRPGSRSGSVRGIRSSKRGSRQGGFRGCGLLPAQGRGQDRPRARNGVPLVILDRHFRFLAGVRLALYWWGVVGTGHGGVITIRASASAATFAQVAASSIKSGVSFANEHWVYTKSSRFARLDWPRLLHGR